MAQRLSRAWLAACSGVRSAIRAVPSLLCDLAGFAGAGSIAYGAWLIFPPAGLITGGLLLMAFALLIGKRIETDKT